MLLRENGFDGFLIGETFMREAARRSLPDFYQPHWKTQKYQGMMLKICGMKFPENIREIEQVRPDWMGFIFYPRSPRFIADLSPLDMPESVNTVGVFVNESIAFVREKCSSTTFRQFSCTDMNLRNIAPICPGWIYRYGSIWGWRRIWFPSLFGLFALL